MPRPPDLQRKHELARRAVALLEREGLDLSTATLADRLGVKRPTFLYHYPTRAELIEAALEEAMVAQAVHVQERVAGADHPIDRLYLQVLAVHEFQEGKERHLVFLTQALATMGADRLRAAVARAAQVFEARRQAHVEALRLGIAERRVAPCDPEALVRLVRAVTDGLVLQRVTDALPLEPVHSLLWHRLLSPLRLPHLPFPPRPKESHDVPASPPRTRRAGPGSARAARRAPRARPPR